MRIAFILWVLLFALAEASLKAQGDQVLAEDEFWRRLAQTGGVLAENPTPDTIAQIDSLWEGVQSVRLKDGTLLPVDPSWITTSARSETPEVRAAAHRYIDSILSRENPSLFPREAASMDTLRDVLSDPRFDYARQIPPTPTPPPQPDVDLPSPAFPEVVLWLLLAIVAIAVVAYIMQTLRVQPASLSPESADDDPKTSAEAVAMAESRESIRDYRAAIRYLFLALLLLLDERGLIHYDPTLTNREHIRQVAANPRLVELFHPVVATFDDVWYGFIPIDESGYRRFAQQVDQLKALVP